MNRTELSASCNKKRIFAAMLLMILLMTGCGQQPVEQKTIEETDIFQFEVADTFALSDGSGVVVAGYVRSGIMRSGDTAVLVKEDGTTLEVKIGSMESYDSQTQGYVIIDEVGVDIPVGVLLEGLEKEQIDIGDILTNSKEYY